MKKISLFTATLLSVTLTLFAAKVEDFKSKQIEEIWKYVWASSDSKKAPQIEKLSEGYVLEQMHGKWTVMFGVIPDKLTLSLATNHLAEVSGKKDGTIWKKIGQWRVESDKLVLFLEEDDIPSFIFKKGKKIYIFDPWAKPMMSELKREK